MKLVKVLTPAPVHETTDSGLIKQIDHYYPNLTGWLKELRDRFEQGYRDTIEPVVAHAEPEEVNCPACGTALTVDQA